MCYTLNGDDMNKKGFTILELAVSITLLIILALILIPNILNQDTKTKQKLYDENITIAKNAAYKYGHNIIDDLSSECTDVSIGTLIKLKYLEGTDKTKQIMINPLTNESMNNEVFCIKFINDMVDVEKR